MRRPTPVERQYLWWREALAGNLQPVQWDFPEAGYFKVRPQGDGHWNTRPYMPLHIWIEQDVDFETGELLSDEQFMAKMGNEECPITRVWPWAAKRPIPVTEWQWLMASMALRK